MAVPADLPLVGGAIGCITCHEGETGRKHINSPRENRVLLRSALGEKDLCSKCHEPYGMDRVDAHAGALSKAHLRGVKVRGFGGGWDRGNHELDFGASPGGENCRSCHDGSIATDVGHTRDQAYGRFGSRPGDGGHPVGGEYRQTNPGEADGRLRPASELDPRIVLIDNKMSCHSCHSIYSQRPNQLVMSNDRSALCLECHQY